MHAGLWLSLVSVSLNPDLYFVHLQGDSASTNEEVINNNAGRCLFEVSSFQCLSRVLYFVATIFFVLLVLDHLADMVIYTIYNYIQQFLL